MPAGMRPAAMGLAGLAAGVATVVAAMLLPASAASAELAFSVVEGEDGTPLSVVETGNRAGSPILFIHGFSQSYLSWRAQLEDPALAARHHLIAIDLRGHGASGKPVDAAAYAAPEPWADDIAAVIRAKKLVKPLLVGWSFGGTVVMAYASRYGTSGLSGINFVATTAAIRADGVRPAPPGPAARAMLAGMVSADIAANHAASGAFVDSMTAKPLPDAERQSLLAAMLMTPPYVRQAAGRLAFDATAIARATSVPVLFTVGALDERLSRAVVDGARRPFPRSDLSLYEGVGHMPFLEAAARFNAELAAFAARAR